MNLKKSWKALSNEFENPDHINLHIQSMILKMINVKDKSMMLMVLKKLNRRSKNLETPFLAWVLDIWIIHRKWFGR